MRRSFEKIICPFCGAKYNPTEFIPKSAGDEDAFYMKCENNECRENIIIVVNIDKKDESPEGLTLFEYFKTNDVCIQAFRGEDDDGE